MVRFAGSVSSYALQLGLLVGFLTIASSMGVAREVDHAKICSAVEKGLLIKLYYRSGEPERIVEPRVLGYTKDRNVILNGWQIAGYSSSGNLPGSRSFRLDQTSKVEFTAEVVKTHVGVGRLPSGIVEVICKKN